MLGAQLARRQRTVRSTYLYLAYFRGRPFRDSRRNVKKTCRLTQSLDGRGLRREDDVLAPMPVSSMPAKNG
ncbi:hypothetical protein BLAT2472_40173 [Burkholderia latens]